MNPSLKLITNDASDKRFYRHLSSDGQSLGVCMQFESWEGGYGGDPLNWLQIHSALREMQIPVPEIYKIDEKDKSIWIEDLGAHFLHSNLNSGILDILDPRCDEIISFYKIALSLLVQAQYSKIPKENPVNSRCFDYQKFYEEMLFFSHYFLNELLELGITKETHAGLYDNLKKLCLILNDYERVFCHRDYHVRNLMIKNSKVYWIDFQDARMGPHSYDVVSLLRDSYVNATWETRQKLFKYYLLELNQKRKNLALAPIPEDQFSTEALFMGLQRNLKAMGSFGYLATKKNKNEYLKYIFNTLEILCSEKSILYKNKELDLNKEFPDLYELIFNLNSGKLKTILNKKINLFLNKDVNK